MEEQIFSWKDWNLVDTMVFQFRKCTLKTNIGPYKKDEFIPIIQMDFGKGIMTFYINEEVEEYKLVWFTASWAYFTRFCRPRHLWYNSSLGGENGKAYS